MGKFEYQMINGELVTSDKAMIPLNDVGLLRSFAVFDFFRVLQNVPIFIEDHMDRAIRSAEGMGIDLQYTREEIRDMCYRLIAANKPGNSGLRILITGGFSDDGYNPTHANIYLSLTSLPHIPEEMYKHGAKLITSEFQRYNPEVKSTMYVHSIKSSGRMKEAGALEISVSQGRQGHRVLPFKHFYCQ